MIELIKQIPTQSNNMSRHYVRSTLDHGKSMCEWDITPTCDEEHAIALARNYEHTHYKPRTSIVIARGFQIRVRKGRNKAVLVYTVRPGTTGDWNTDDLSMCQFRFGVKYEGRCAKAAALDFWNARNRKTMSCEYLDAIHPTNAECKALLLDFADFYGLECNVNKLK